MKKANIFAFLLIISLAASGCINNNKSENQDQNTESETVVEQQDKTDCNQFDKPWNKYEQNGLSFCYNPEWGETVLKETSIDPLCRQGTIYHITFTEPESPTISYSTLDYKRTCESDVSQVDWSIFPEKDEREIRKYFEERNYRVNSRYSKYEDNSFRIDGLYDDPLSQDLYQQIEYFYPNAKFNNQEYNLHIIYFEDAEDVDLENISDVEKVIKTLDFK